MTVRQTCLLYQSGRGIANNQGVDPAGNVIVYLSIKSGDTFADTQLIVDRIVNDGSGSRESSALQVRYEGDLWLLVSSICRE